MDKVVLRHEGAVAEICLHGGHLISWKSPSGEDLIFLSKKAIFEPPKAIRGGVPICFPQFGMMGPMSTQHGFARNTAFSVESQSENSATLVLCFDGQGQPSFPHPFELRTVVTLAAASLSQELHVKNSGAGSFSFTCALHTYYQVASIDQVQVLGLQGVGYLDNLQGTKVAGCEGPITFQGELDRVYCEAPDLIQINDRAGGRQFDIKKSGFGDAVVWNPWIEKAAKMADFGDDEYKTMLCIEPAVAASGAVSLEAGATWTGVQSITYRALEESAASGNKKQEEANPPRGWFPRLCT